MHPIDAASRGSTRALYLSCDGSRSGGGGAFVPDWRRSIIPRVYRCCFCLPPGLGLAGLLALSSTGDVLELEDRLSLNNSCGAREVYRLPQRCSAATLLWLASVLQHASCRSAAAGVFDRISCVGVAVTGDGIASDKCSIAGHPYGRHDATAPPNTPHHNPRRDQQTKKGPHVHRAAARAARSRRGVRFYWPSIRSARE